MSPRPMVTLVDYDIHSSLVQLRAARIRRIVLMSCDQVMVHSSHIDMGECPVHELCPGSEPLPPHPPPKNLRDYRPSRH